MNWKPTREAAQAHLTEFLPDAGRRYADTRNFDDGTGRDNVSQLSPWLHAGLLGESELCEAVLAHHSLDAAEKFIAEVFWRVYFKSYLEQRPSIWHAYLDERDASFAKLDKNKGLRTAYDEAVESRSGIAAFDHWARELTETGYLHNHARMWFASIWIFTLKLDWQLGADFFLRHLLDGDAASNTLSWRWIGGLHTEGKTYLARASNIERYTANHPNGPLEADGLSEAAEPLEEPREHGRQTLDLPDRPDESAFAQPFALLLHDEAASHVPLNLPSSPELVIGAARPEARSGREVSDAARSFARDATSNGMTEAAQAYECQGAEWTEQSSLSAILDDAGIERIAVPYLPIGWTRDALWPELTPLAKEGRIVILPNDLNRLIWPHAKAGFFGVKKQSEGILRELGIM